MGGAYGRFRSRACCGALNVRDSFIRTLISLADKDPRIVLMTGDLGFGVLEEFEARFPQRYFNAGVAEQNLAAVASGLAMEGHVVFTYSIGNFPTLRCLEQLRNDALYHEAPVKVVCIGGGFSYGPLGMSHHATEDLSIMRALPNLTISAPATAFETTQIVEEIARRPGASYLRIERGSPDFVDSGAVPFTFGKARQLREGRDFCVIAAGGITVEAVRAAEQLSALGIQCRVLSMHTLKPFDADTVLRAAAETGGIVTVEENTVIGGLGGAVAEACLEGGVPPRRFHRIGMRDQFSVVVGDQAFLRCHYGMDATAIVSAVQRLLGTADSGERLEARSR